jgi:hypothetical protein
MNGGRLKLGTAVELAIHDILGRKTESRSATELAETSWAAIRSSRFLLAQAAAEMQGAWHFHRPPSSNG